jgi:Polyketide cyclase / dehydrase and lipid transport
MGFVRLVDIEVAAPPAQIFPLVSDIRRHPEWAYNTLTVAHVDGPEIGPGAHYTSTVTDAVPGSKKPAKGDIRVLKSDAPELFVYECTDDAGTYRWSVTISRWNDATTVTHTVERLVGPWYVRMLQPTLWAMFGGKQVRGGLTKLKQLAERPAPVLPKQRKAVELPTEQRASQ